MLGTILSAIASFVDFSYQIIEKVIKFIVNSADAIKSIFLPLIIFIVIGMFIFPPLALLLFTELGSILFIVFILLLFISILGKAFLNWFKKIKYAQIKYLKDLARYKKEKSNPNKSYSFYKDDYDRIQREKFEEDLRREAEARRKRQQAQEEQWRRFFEENFGGYGGSYDGNFGGQGGSYNRNQGSPFTSFKQQYENACDVLGVQYSSDFQTIKSKYRQLAKKYHPDLSTEKNAEEMFKKVNNAFDFLSEENVRRYKTM